MSSFSSRFHKYVAPTVLGTVHCGRICKLGAELGLGTSFALSQVIVCLDVVGGLGSNEPKLRRWCLQTASGAMATRRARHKKRRLRCLDDAGKQPGFARKQDCGPAQASE